MKKNTTTTAAADFAARQQNLRFEFTGQPVTCKRPRRSPRHEEYWSKEKVLHFIALLPPNGKVSPKQLSQILGVHLQTLYKWMRDNRLPRPHYIGLKKTFWDAKAIGDWIAETAATKSYFYTT